MKAFKSRERVLRRESFFFIMNFMICRHRYYIHRLCMHRRRCFYSFILLYFILCSVMHTNDMRENCSFIFHGKSTWQKIKRKNSMKKYFYVHVYFCKSHIFGDQYYEEDNLYESFHFDLLEMRLKLELWCQC